MLGTTDLTNIEELERLRRSVAMEPASTGTRLLTREEVLRLIQALLDATRAVPPD